MSFCVDSTRLAWLAAAVSRQKNTITDLMSRMTGLMSKSSIGGMKPIVFGKFMGLLEQVAVAHDEEVRLINRIEAIEALHKFQRKHKQLQTAEYDPSADTLPLVGPEPIKKRPGDSLLLLLGLWYLATRKGLKQ